VQFEKTFGWLKEIVKDYTNALQNYTLSGTHQPDCMAFVERKPQTYYNKMYVVANTKCHKAFNVLLDDALFSESRDNEVGDKKRRGKQLRQQHRK
jgi:hypothetical protein